MNTDKENLTEKEKKQKENDEIFVKGMLKRMEQKKYI